MWFKVLLSFVLFLNLAGCATARKDVANLEMQQLKMRVSDLETQLQQKDDEISYLEQKLAKTKEKITPSAKKTASAKKSSSSATTKNIQRTLKKSGFYSGPIDGKMGTGTKQAIKEFQKANGLSADGIVGKQTWLKLKKYLQ